MARIFSEVYDELRRLAHYRMVREPAQTIGATCLVHEAFLRLQNDDRKDPGQWEERAHFFYAASEAMRRILVERARARSRLKRGGDLDRSEMSLTRIEAPVADEEILSVDEALSELERVDPEGAELVKLKYFVGLKWEEIAEIKNVSTRSLHRKWSYARVILREAIERGASDGDR